MAKKILAVLCIFILVFAACASAELSMAGEDIIFTDDDATSWYDVLYQRMSKYKPKPGKVEGNALRVQGQPALEKAEIKMLFALEDVDLVDNEMLDDEGKIRIMLIGIDARPGQKNGRSDCMILVDVDVRTYTIKMVSFMRDMYVSIPGYSPNKLNVAYYWGGIDLMRQVYAKNFGVAIDHYIAVNFSLLADLVDQLGGIEIDVADDYFVDRINAVIKQDNLVLGLKEKDGLLKGPGRQLLTGKQTQAYARFRYGARSGGDYKRTERQREVITKIFHKVTELTIPQMAAMALNNLSKVQTDLTLPDIIELAPVLLKLKDAEIDQLRIPQDGSFTNETVNGMAVLVPNLKKSVAQLREFLEVPAGE